MHHFCGSWPHTFYFRILSSFWLKRCGVNPLSLGVGRGLGLRWNKIEVAAAIEGAILPLQKKEPEQENTQRRPPLSRRPLVGRPLKEQLALIAGAKLQ